MAVERSKTLADQVNSILRQRIRENTYPPGQRLPSESDLAQEFGVSRASIRTALAQLAVEGLILRKQGDGTYVNERLTQANAHSGGLWEFTRLIESSGHQASIREVHRSLRTATAQEAHTLNLAANEEVITLDRVFFADHRPVIFAQNILPRHLLRTPDEEIDGNAPIRALVKDHCDKEIAFALSDIRATLTTETLVQHLERAVNTPLLKLKIIFYDQNNMPLLFGTSYLDDDVLNLRLVQTWGS